MRKLFIELIVLLGIGGLIWAAFALFVNLPARPSLVSRQTETEIGTKVREAIIRTNGFELTYRPESEPVLQEIADRIMGADTSAGKLAIEIINHDMVNAFALPGGYIMVTTGLIDFCESAEEFVSVVCHEAAHVINRDVLNGLSVRWDWKSSYQMIRL
jgi:beta-barrel assembly-enhancing protease